MAKKIEKTNAARLLDKAGIKYDLIPYEFDENDLAAQHVAAVGKDIVAEVFDLSHYENLKTQYKVMSVPCMVINDEHVYFGKKNISQVLDIIEQLT